MPTRYGRTPWLENVPPARRPDYPRLRGEHVSDVVVVGGGLTGCATALACAVDGHRTVLLDADRLGRGSTARSAGLLLPGPPVPFRDLSGAHGRATARAIYQAWRRASSEAAAQLTRLKIHCGLVRLDAIELESRAEATLRREFAARTEAGLPVHWLGPHGVRRAAGMELVQGGLGPGHGFALDPYRACIGLAAAAARRGVQLSERTTVRRITPGAEGAEITTDGARIRAKRVIVATGVPTPAFKPLMRHFTARDTYVVLSEPLPLAMRRRSVPTGVLLLEGPSPRRLVYATADHRLLVTGADQDATAARRRDAVLVQRTGQLMYELLLMYPAISGLRPAFGWDARYGTTADGILYAGAHRHFPRHLFAFGAQESVTGAFLAAGVLRRAVRDGASKADAVFGWNR